MARRERPFVWLLIVSLLMAGGTHHAFAAADLFERLVAKRQYAKAAALVSQSAKGGNALSQYRLAVMLRSGLGVARNEGLARSWLRKSADAGNGKARLLLARLSKIVTTEAIGATAVPSLRSARIAVIERLPKQQSGAPALVTIVAARPFDDVVGGSTSWVGLEGTETPLIAAIRAGNARMVGRILADGADVEAADARGFTALHWAAEGGDAGLFRLLLSANANVGRVNKAGATPADLVARHCNREMLDAIGAADRQIKAAFGARLVHLLVRHCDDPQAFDGLIDARSIDQRDALGRTLLWYAARRSSRRWCAFLIGRGVSTTTADIAGLTPLHLAAATGDQDLAALLLANGADPEAHDASANTPLMLAAAGGHAGSVAKLLPLASNIDRKNAQGETALLLAVRSGSADVVRLLVRAGASPSLRTLARDTPEKIVARLDNAALSAALP